MEAQKDEKVVLPSSKDLKKLLAGDKVEKVLLGLGAINASHESPSFSDGLTLLNGRWESWQQQFQIGSANYDDLNVSKIQIRQAALALINQLPEGMDVSVSPKPRGILESRFKKQLFWAMILSKLGIICFIWFHQSTGGFSQAEAIACITLLLPIFTAYVSVMVSDSIGDKYVDSLRKITDPYIKPKLRNMAYILIPLYVVFLTLIISAKPSGSINYERMNTLLALVEAGFGVYVGKIIFSIFRK